MDQVERIAADNTRRDAEKALAEVLEDMVVYWACEEKWMRSAGPTYRDAVIGTRWQPNYTAEQIRDAYKNLKRGYKYNTPPKVAVFLEKAREILPPAPMQKRHTDPTPQRKWTDAERAANIAKVDEILAYCARQNEDPEYAEALMTHGKGSPELARVVDRQRAEMQAWLRH